MSNTGYILLAVITGIYLLMMFLLWGVGYNPVIKWNREATKTECTFHHYESVENTCTSRLCNCDVPCYDIYVVVYYIQKSTVAASIDMLVMSDEENQSQALESAANDYPLYETNECWYVEIEGEATEVKFEQDDPWEFAVAMICTSVGYLLFSFTFFWFYHCDYSHC